MELIEYPDSEMMMIDLASRIADELEACLREQDHVSLAVPGGTTPGPLFDDLCGVAFGPLLYLAHAACVPKLADLT